MTDGCGRHRAEKSGKEVGDRKHAPYYTRHVISPARVLSDSDDVVKLEASYAVFRTRRASVSEVYNVGRYVDEIARAESGLEFRRRLCVYDSEMILNSLIYSV